MMCSELVTLIWEDASGQVRLETGNLEEIAEQELTVLLDHAPHDGARIRLNCQGKELRGTVDKASQDHVLGHFVHVNLDADSRWSERWFTPAHLLKLWSASEEKDSGAAA